MDGDSAVIKARNTAACDMRHSKFCAFNLSFASAALQLMGHLDNLGNARGTNGMTA
jgi:hypothetical protein